MSRCEFVTDLVLNFLKYNPGVAVITLRIGAGEAVELPSVFRLAVAGQLR